MNLLLGRFLVVPCLRHGLVLSYSTAVLRRQGAAIGVSEWIAREDFDWARELTRRPKNMRVALPFESLWVAPTEMDGQ